MGKRKKVVQTTENVSTETTNASTGETGVSSTSIVTEQVDAVNLEKIPVFKDPKFVLSSKTGSGAVKKTRVWKTLKQIIASERLLPRSFQHLTYSSLEAPPSCKPTRKYSDLTGLPAKYTDPQTKLRYANTEEYSQIRMMQQEMVYNFLALRKAVLP